MRWNMTKTFIACAAAAALLPSIASAEVHDLGGRRDDFRSASATRYDRGDLNRGHDDSRYDDSRHDRNDFRRDDFRRSDDVRIDIGIGQRRDSYEARTDRVWVEPVYRTTYDRVWVAPVVQDVCDRVWVEPVYEIRETVSWEHGRRIVRRDRCLVSPGHFEERHRQVVISDGHWENVARQELVSAGHWEYRTIQYRVPEPSGWNFSFGYGR
jgi:hypothetical protein